MATLEVTTFADLKNKHRIEIRDIADTLRALKEQKENCRLTPQKYPPLSEEEEDLLKDLLDLQEELEFPDSGDDTYLLDSNYMDDIAKEKVDEEYGPNQHRKWPFKHIDWDEAGKDLDDDYSSVDIDGDTYYHIT